MRREGIRLTAVRILQYDIRRSTECLQAANGLPISKLLSQWDINTLSGAWIQEKG
ncbi:hypothetical protein Vi05172_g10597 [Venturia inaequalis]|nr:hypothetical protein Vi05172_g10597 [Venturia inaequalis]